MKAEKLIYEIKKSGIENLIGVPDSTLKEFCNYINGEGKDELIHVTPHNEGAAVGMATGVYLSTGKPACVYMQNSGLGNIVNPVTSIANEAVYGIPMLFLIGWRGEPGVHDEPQHVFMGEVTLKVLDVMDIPYSVISKETSDEELENIFKEANRYLGEEKQYAIVIKKGTFEAGHKNSHSNAYTLVRENAISTILKSLKEDDVVISTTGKISREVYEQSDVVLGQHAQEFLTVGGMGHASMIALGYAMNKRDKRVICIDGDGAVLMHMGAFPVIGKVKPSNYVHICINNDSHESVGGMPTGAVGQDYYKIAEECGYTKGFVAATEEELEKVLESADKIEGPVFIEVKVSMESRADLGRPKETAQENKKGFMKYHGVSK